MTRVDARQLHAARAPFVALQYLLPQHFLSRLVHALTRSRVRAGSRTR